jgi:glucose-1-phosphate thymidylyltransferase
VVLPADALLRLHSARVDQHMDVMLGVFPVDEPERLGPVELAPDGTVLHIHDKPGHRRWMNAWALVAWNSQFTRFCCDWDDGRARAGTPEGVLSHAMEAARVAGLKVGAVQFSDGVFADIGTPTGLASTVHLLMQRGLTLTERA